MLTDIRSYARQSRYLLRKWASDPAVHKGMRITQCLLTGFLLSAAGLGQYMQPLAMGPVLAADPWCAVLTALGGSLGYWVFWGNAGLQGIAWLAAGVLLSLLLGLRPSLRGKSLLLPAAASLTVAAAGLLFQLRLGDTTPVLIYLLRLTLAAGTSVLFRAQEQSPTVLSRELTRAVWVLALAQIFPAPWLCLGTVAAGTVFSTGSFSGAAMAGLALDLAQVTPVSMTAVACAAWFVRQLPRSGKWVKLLIPGFLYPVVMGLSGHWDLMPLPGLLAGGLLGFWVSEQTPTGHRRGETGVVQVRLELAAGVLSQVQQLLLETVPAPVDEEALVRRAGERACGGCPCRKACKDRESVAALSAQLLHRPLLDGRDLGVSCRKEARLLLEMHRAQEQLRTIRNSREQQKECRSAVIQQYRFMAAYLQDLSDELGRRTRSAVSRFQPMVFISANRSGADNGDRIQSFSGTGCRHYVLLCDGMGTGSGAIDEGGSVCAILKRLLSAGFPPEYALRMVNSICALRGLAGAVTVDLAELQLDTGKVQLYKWGAAASFVIRSAGAEKIGTAGPPPGLSVTEGRETVERLSLRRGETLVLCSDGVNGEEVLHDWCCAPDEPPGELAARILDLGAASGTDDATVAVVRLMPS